jgi:hypothetical protein
MSRRCARLRAARALLLSITIMRLILNMAAAGLIAFDASHDDRSAAAAVRIELSSFRAALQWQASTRDPLSQDPEREEDFLAPEFSWFVAPGWTVRAQFSKALRSGSADQALLAASYGF